MSDALTKLDAQTFQLGPLPADAVDEILNDHQVDDPHDRAPGAGGLPGLLIPLITAIREGDAAAHDETIFLSSSTRRYDG